MKIFLKGNKAILYHLDIHTILSILAKERYTIIVHLWSEHGPLAAMAFIVDSFNV